MRWICNWNFFFLILILITEEDVAEAQKRTESIKTGIFDRANTEHLLPPDMESLSHMRQYAYKKRKMKAIVKEIMYYLIYAAVIVLLGYSLRDENAFLQTKNLEDLFSLNDKFQQVR